MSGDETRRCDWANHSLREQEYHDHQWGVPVHDERELFKMLILEGKQAGLSWSTILLKMETLCAAFDDFDPAVIANYDTRKVERLLQNSGIIRNRLKVNAAIHNAKAYFKLCRSQGSLDRFFWSYVNYQPIVNAWSSMAQVPASTPLSEAISRDLKKFDFKFVGSSIIYAFMQSVGMVNDHLTSCPRYNQV
ncbi:MAG: DNA-3-methyladenine glycosylase I [Candidatus Adiutrix sp.]|jgi:DNA-3-methyladenine glycosylase I|nr:DNA-3-methyladenine glycosylase I [Candidatus Adiutrix sp.]